MAVLLTVVAVVSFVVGQPETGLLVSLLVLLNVGLGARQELVARAGVAALAGLQVQSARVVRDGVRRPGAGGRARPRRRRDARSR